jgi:hypothetical protein
MDYKWLVEAPTGGLFLWVKLRCHRGQRCAEWVPKNRATRFYAKASAEHHAAIHGGRAVQADEADEQQEAAHG